MADGPEGFDGVITVEWRAAEPGRLMAGWTFRIRGEDGEFINTVSDMTLRVSAEGGVWAELDMFTDPDGRPAASTASVSTVHLGDDGELLHGVFRYQVAGMSVTA